MMIRRAALAGIVVSLLIVVAAFANKVAKSNKMKSYTAHTRELLINGAPYEGRALFVSKEGEEFFPLSPLAERLGVSDCEVGRKSLMWNGEERPYEKGDILKGMAWGGPKEDFIRMSAIEGTLGLSVVSDSGKIRSIDNYPSLNYAWADSNSWIALQMGGLDGEKATGCKEAFERGYKQGMRLFEADILLTSDGAPVVVRDWKSFRKMCGLEDDIGAMDEEAFLASKILGKYTPLTCEDVCGLLTSHTDAYLVFEADQADAADTKKVAQAFLKEADRFDGSVLDRIVVQTSSVENLDVIMGLRLWDSVIFRMDPANAAASTEQTVKAAMEKGVRLFAVSRESDDDYLIEAIHSQGGKVFLYECDDKEEVISIRESKGVDGFYTNFLDPIK